MDTIYVTKVKSTTHGSCNFCRKYSDEVYEITGNTVVVRMCPVCLKLLNIKILMIEEDDER